jgi:hypothetical protein
MQVLAHHRHHRSAHLFTIRQKLGGVLIVAHLPRQPFLSRTSIPYLESLGADLQILELPRSFLYVLHFPHPHQSLFAPLWLADSLPSTTHITLRQATEVACIYALQLHRPRLKRTCGFFVFSKLLFVVAFGSTSLFLYNPTVAPFDLASLFAPVAFVHQEYHCM